MSLKFFGVKIFSLINLKKNDPKTREAAPVPTKNLSMVQYDGRGNPRGKAVLVGANVISIVKQVIFNAVFLFTLVEF